MLAISLWLLLFTPNYVNICVGEAYMFYELEYHQLGKDVLLSTQHSHADCLEIIQTLTGDGQVLIRDNLYPMTAGCIYLIDGTETHSTKPRDPETYLRNKIILSAETVMRAAEALGINGELENLFYRNGGKYCVLGKEQAQQADALFKGICEQYRHGRRYDSFMLWSDLFRLLSLSSAGRATDEGAGDMIDRILTYINDNISGRLSLDDISRSLHVDKYYMCHYFKDKIGMTVMDYIADRRINMAKRMLLNTGSTITEISGKCGYSSASYFTQAFTKLVGKTPSGFRSEPYQPSGTRPSMIEEPDA